MYKNMGRKMNKIALLFLIYLLSSCSIAADKTIVIPENETQRVSAQSLSLTSEAFFKAYMSEDIEQRRLAEMYVAGVLDASEGISWCGYSIASPTAIQEQVYSGLKKMLKHAPKERASTAIKSKLEELLPCKENK